MEIVDVIQLPQLIAEKLSRCRYAAPNLFAAGALLFLCSIASKPARGQSPCGSYNPQICTDVITASLLGNGPVMQAPYQIYLLFWLPQGFSLDPSAMASNDVKYESILKNFFTDLSGSNYLDIVSQYPAPCGPPSIPANQSCFGSGSLNIKSQVVITTAYPHAGTHNDPLQDTDIQTVVTNYITSNNVAPGLNTEFFVFTGSAVVVCQGGGCTDAPTLSQPQICDWHSAFPLNGNGPPVIYSLISNGQPNNCQCNITSPNGLASADCAIIGASHEFFESMSDPLWALGIPNFGWVDANVKNNQVVSGNEIGDQCNGLTGPLTADGANITLNGHAYVVQQMWSNDDAGCVLTFGQTALTGPSIEYDVGTGNNPLDTFSSATATRESGLIKTLDELKAQGQPSWNTNSTHVRAFGILGNHADDVVVSLTSPGTWDIRDFTVTIRNPNGDTACGVGFFGFPLATLNLQMPQLTLNTPVCH